MTSPMERAFDAISKLAAIELLCRKHANPASNTGAHALANRVLAILDPNGAHAAAVAATEPERLPPRGQLADLLAEGESI